MKILEMDISMSLKKASSVHHGIHLYSEAISRNPEGSFLIHECTSFLKKITKSGTEHWVGGRGVQTKQRVRNFVRINGNLMPRKYVSQDCSENLNY